MQQYGEPVTAAEIPIPVVAWIPTVNGQEMYVEEVVMAWTPRAVRGAYTDRYDHEDSAWVWAGAVRRT